MGLCQAACPPQLGEPTLSCSIWLSLSEARAGCRLGGPRTDSEAPEEPELETSSENEGGRKRGGGLNTGVQLLVGWCYRLRRSKYGSLSLVLLKTFRIRNETLKNFWDGKFNNISDTKWHHAVSYLVLSCFEEKNLIWYPTWTHFDNLTKMTVLIDDSISGAGRSPNMYP